MSPLVLFTLAGYAVSTLLWLGAVAGLVTVLLYIMRVRRRGVAVPYIALFERILLERRASTLRSRLRRYLSLLLHLILVGLLVLALGDPRPEGQREEGRTIAVLVDVSASMGNGLQGAASDRATAGTLLDAAKNEAKSWLKGLGPGDRMLLIEAGQRPRPVSGWTNDRRALEEAIGNLMVQDTQSDMDAAVELSRDALHGRPHPEIIVVSDGRFSLDPERGGQLDGIAISYQGVGDATEEEIQNVGISAFAARRYPLDPNRYEALIEVHNGGGDAAQVELVIYEVNPDESEGHVVELEQLSLAPGERAARRLPDLAQLQQGLLARVRRVDGGADQLPADDVARALLAPLPPLRVLVVGESSTFLEAALLLDPTLNVERVIPESYPPAGDYDVTIFDGVFPERVARTGAALYLGAPAAEAAMANHPAEFGKELSMFGFDRWQKNSDVFRFIDPYDIQVLAGRELKPGAGDTVLGRSQNAAIFISGERSEGRFMALGFDPKKSDFVLRAAWPLFMQNVVGVLAPRSTEGARLGLETGQLWRVAVPAPTGGQARVAGPLASAGAPEMTVPVNDGEATWFGERAGFYEVRAGQNPLRLAASFFDKNELQEPPKEEFSIAGQPVGAVEGFQPRSDRQLWFWLVVAVLVASFVEWWTYHKRWTV